MTLQCKSKEDAAGVQAGEQRRRSPSPAHTLIIWVHCPRAEYQVLIQGTNLACCLCHRGCHTSVGYEHCSPQSPRFSATMTEVLMYQFCQDNTITFENAFRVEINPGESSQPIRCRLAVACGAKQSVWCPSASKEDHTPGQKGDPSFPMQLYHNPPWDFAIISDHSVIHKVRHRKGKA